MKIAFGEARYQDCAALVQKILDRDPANYDALLQSGNLKLAKGEATGAIAEFERIEREYKPVPQVKCRLALAYLMSGNCAAAMGSLSEALILAPDFEEAILLLADLNIREGNGASAIVSLTELLKHRPQTAQAYLLLAEAYLVQKNIDQSLRVYRQAMELFPRDPQVPFLIGMVLEEQSKRAEARKAFEKSPEVSPDYLPALEQLVELDVSEAQYATAMDRVKKGVEKNPTMAQLWVLQARIHLAQRDTSQAEADLSRAINLNPDLQTAYLLLAQLYVASDRPSQAMERLAALAARTNDLTALMQIGRMQEELKNSHAARNAYEKLLVANPDFSPASDQVRLCTRRFISRHFQQPIYDYRSVWTSFTGGIASRVNELKLSQAAVKLVADIFQVLSVSIWLVDDHGGNLTFAASSSLLETTGEAVRPQNADAIELIRALRHHPDPVDIDASKENWAAEPSSP